MRELPSEQPLAVVTADFYVDDRARRGRARKFHRKVLLGAALRLGFDEYAPRITHFRVEMPAQRQRAVKPQPLRALFDGAAIELRHARRRRSRPRRKWKYVKVRQSAFVDQVERARKHLLRFGRETGDDVGAEHDVGTNAAQLPAESDSVVAGVPPYPVPS